MDRYKPPYTLTDEMINLVASITEIIALVKINNPTNTNPKLRRNNRIKTIQASLAIENNSLSLEQVTDIINGKTVLGKPSEIAEVKNAFVAYEKILTLNPYSLDDLLYSHGLLMNNLTAEAGHLRSGNVGIFSDNHQLVHMAPPAENVHYLISELLTWVNNANVHPLIKSCVFHYEFEFIHPFSDGNGRMGRLWQTLLLYQWNTLFGWLPVETLIKENQSEYYQVLGEADKESDSKKFIEFILKIIYKALKDLIHTDQVSDQDTAQVSDQVKRLLRVINDEELTTTQLMERLELKHRATFRKNYLLPALENNLIVMTIPNKPNSRNQKYRRK